MSYIGVRTGNGNVLLKEADYKKNKSRYQGCKATHPMEEKQAKNWLKQVGGKEYIENDIEETLDGILSELDSLSRRADEIEKNAEKEQKHISHEIEKMNARVNPIVRLVDGALSKSKETYSYSDISRIIGTEKGEGEAKENDDDPDAMAVAYTDGSYCQSEGVCGWGFVLVYSERLANGTSEERMEFSSGAGNVEQLAKRGAQAGEFAAAEEAVKLALRLGKDRIIIVHDREDVNPYAGAGSSKTAFASGYYDWIRAQPCKISFRKVKAHTKGELRNPLNAMADSLASGAASDMAKKISQIKSMF